MFRNQDPNSVTFSQPLCIANTNPNGGKDVEIGLMERDYSVTLFDDVQASGKKAVAKPGNRQYVVKCTQRVTISNLSNLSVAPIQIQNASQEFYSNYPALLQCDVKINGANRSGLRFELLDYSPKTVNTAIQQSTSNSSSQGTSTGQSTSSTTGSSTSESNTYGTTVTLGDTFSGVSATYEHTSTTTSEQSQTVGSEQSRSANRDSGASASMSIKDWGAYATVNPKFAIPIWVFGQEYPWNAIECRYSQGAVNAHNKDQVRVQISQSMSNNLYDGLFLYPPSELSQFSISFVMKTSWRVYVDFGESSELEIDHGVLYFSASHIYSADEKCPAVYVDRVGAQLYLRAADGSSGSPSARLDLAIVALEPIGRRNKAAIVGFAPNRFVPPVASNAPNGAAARNFRVFANTNDLIVEDTTAYGANAASGFAAQQSCLVATWSGGQSAPYELTLYFKILDVVSDYTLYLKGWRGGAAGVYLTFIVNDGDQTPIVKYLDAREGEGGDANLLTIGLRNLDFASTDYHDFLQLGLNAIRIRLQPAGGASGDVSFQIRALSVEKD